METIKLGILAIIQGITELLPISSSGHLLLFGDFLNISVSTLLLSVFHLGTTMAIVIFFREKLFKDIFSKEKLTFYLKILVASIPAGIVGFLFQDIIEEKLRATWIIAISLIVWGIVMLVMEQKKKASSMKDIEKVSWKQSILIGISQTFALIPGTSRSGITTIAGMGLGLDKYTALEYSFILGIPVLLGSSMYEILKSFLSQGESVTTLIATASIMRIFVVALIPFVVGYTALLFLKKIQRKNWLTIFGIYRIVLGILILLLI